MLATKFFEHFIYVGAAMKKMGGRDYQLWDEQDGFFYDVLRLPNGDFKKFRLRSMVGLIPLYAVEVIERDDLDPHPEFLGNVEWFIKNRPDLVGNACYSIEGQRWVLSIADSGQFARILQHLWDPKEFLCPARHSQPFQVSRAASVLLRRRMCRIRTRGIERAHQGWEFQLARSVVVSDDLPADSFADEVQPRARTRLRGENTGQQRPADYALRHGGGNRRSHDRDIPQE